MTAARAPALASPGAILLLSCYELGHPPHGVALALGALERAGFAPAAQDLAVERLAPRAVELAQLIAISIPMHTALRLAVPLVARLRALAPAATLCAFGHYAELLRRPLAELGIDHVLGGELEAALVGLARDLDRGPAVTAAAPILERLDFAPPSRRGLPTLDTYARFVAADGRERVVGYAETSRGCLDRCRHCPIPAVYGGRFFVVPRAQILADLEAQIAAGARHLTFGDPDFLNGPGHAMAVVRELHRRHPEVSFDVTAQVRHLLDHPALVAELVELGCAFCVSAFESTSDRVLAELAKRHRRRDLDRVLDLADTVGLTLRPTFVPFTPWTTLADLVELTDFIAERDLVGAVAPVQLSVRLLVPPGSLLLAGPAAAAFGPYDPDALGHPWRHPDPRLDLLAREIGTRVARATAAATPDHEVFGEIRQLVRATAELPAIATPSPRRAAPHLTEPWFC